LSAGSYGLGLGWAVLDRAWEAGLEPEHFFLATHAALWGLLVQLRNDEIALDPVTVSRELERLAEERIGPLGELLQFDVAALRGRLHELAHEVTCFSSVEHRAAIILRDAERRAREFAS
jgi:hypothetical protein